LGLIGGLMIPLLVGFTPTLFSPKAFLLDPGLWLRLIAETRAEITMAPNFAYHLLARRVDPADLRGLDLSCLRIALNGAEPIDPETVRAFNRRFAPLGWRPEAVIGVYGLAEVALGVCVPAPGSGLETDPIDPDRLRGEGVAAPPSPDGQAREMACAGAPLPGFEVAILDAEGRRLPERQEGAIAVSGPSVMTGYWRSPEATARALVDGWLLTGDLGYMADGKLFVTGREKDLIIRGGRNYHPQELERAAETVPGVRGGSALAFGVPDPATGTEKVIVAFETREAETAPIARAVASAVLAATGLRPEVAMPLPPGSAPKTTSGKRQRHEARARYMAGTLGQAEHAMGAIKVAIGHHLAGWRKASS
ncbi:MAG: AMP-binding protein, partial [Candidatus Sericytochromatia bacterium]